MKLGGLLILLLALPALAGCATNPVAPAATNATAPAAAPALPPINKTFQVSNAAAEPGAGVEPTDTERVSLDVPEGYTHVKAELKATCATPTCGYGLALTREGKDVAADRAGKIDASVTPGKHELYARSTGPSAGMTGTITVVLT